MTITLYDLVGSKKDIAWNPNVLKVRIALNYKGLPFKTEWVEYPHVEPLLKKIGGAPTSKKADGRDHYTLPVIHDSATGRVISESADIVAYLDEQYPETVPLFPKDTKAAIALFDKLFLQNIVMPFLPIALPELLGFLNPISSAYFRQTREEMFGKKLEEMAPVGSPERAKSLASTTTGLTELGKMYDKNGQGKSYFFGDKFTYADAIIIGWLGSFKLIMGPESDSWKALADADGRRWDKLVEATNKLRAV